MKISGIIAILVIAIAIAVVIVTFGDASSYEDFKAAKNNPGVTFHVVGKLAKDKPQVYDPEKNADRFEFYMRDSLNTMMKVTYMQGKPTDFDKPEKLVVIGKALNDSIFEADQILQKCPSKYKEDELQTVNSEAP